KEVNLGTFELVVNDETGEAKIVYTFNDKIENIESIENAFVEMNGSFKQEGDGIEIPNGNGPSIHINVESNKGEQVDGPLPGMDGDETYRDKWGEKSQDKADSIKWNVEINKKNHKEFYENGQIEEIEEYEDLILWDKLTDGMTVTLDDIIVSGVLRAPTQSENYTASAWGVEDEVTGSFKRTKITKDEMTEEEFEETVKAASEPTIFLYDNYYVAIAFGDFPNVIKYNQDWLKDDGSMREAALYFLQDTFKDNVENLPPEVNLEEMADIIVEKYGSASALKQRHIELRVSIHAQVPHEGEFNNKASISVNGADQGQNTENTYEYVGISSGGSSAVKGALKIIKKDAKRSEEHTSELQSRFDLVCRL